MSNSLPTCLLGKMFLNYAISGQEAREALPTIEIGPIWRIEASRVGVFAKERVAGSNPVFRSKR